jgi:predicted enzyme related to lactoylglutathione lyase
MSPHPTFAYVTISSHGADRLVRFYGELTGQPIAFEAGAYTVIGGGEGAAPGARLAFQQIAPGQPVIPAHVDLHVGDIGRASERVLALGGRVGDEFEEVGSVWRHAFDPDGNVFCLMRQG